MFCYFQYVGGKQDRIIIVYSDQATVKGTMDVGTKGKAVGNAVVMGNAEGNNMAGIHE